jgi:hypothetical protein
MNNDVIAKVYANLIKNGKKTIDEVPEKLKEKVEKLIAE